MRCTLCSSGSKPNQRPSNSHVLVADGLSCGRLNQFRAGCREFATFWSKFGRKNLLGSKCGFRDRSCKVTFPPQTFTNQMDRYASWLDCRGVVWWQTPRDDENSLLSCSQIGPETPSAAKCRFSGQIECNYPSTTEYYRVFFTFETSRPGSSRVGRYIGLRVECCGVV